MKITFCDLSPLFTTGPPPHNMQTITLPFSKTPLHATDECIDTIVQANDGCDYIVCKNKTGVHEWVLYNTNKTDDEKVDVTVFLTLRDIQECDHSNSTDNKKKRTNNSLKSKVESNTTGSEKRGRGRPRKNPDAIPRKPRQPTAYNMFLKETLPALKESHPHLSNKERMQMASKLWNAQK